MAGIEFRVETVLLGCGSPGQALMAFLPHICSFRERGLPVGMSPAGEWPGATACSGHSILTRRVAVLADVCELGTGLVELSPVLETVGGWGPDDLAVVAAVQAQGLPETEVE